MAGYNTNTSEIYKILFLVWKESESKYNKIKVGIKSCRLLVLVLYPAMMVGNNYIE